MTSTTALGYGLTVRATDLVTAAQTWPTLKDRFKFFDLLFLRKRSGTLRATGERATTEDSVLEKLPVEVWEEIRGWTALSEMEDEEERMLAKYVDYCEAEKCECQDRGRVNWKIFGSPVEFCPKAMYPYEIKEFRVWWKSFSKGSATAIKPINELLASFGLALPLSRTNRFEFDYSTGLLDVAFITTPIRTRGSSHSNFTWTYDDYVEAENKDTCVDVSFKVPPDADSRFFRFIRTFDLKVVRVSTDKLECQAPDSTIEGKSGEINGMKEENVKVVHEIKPTWKLYICTISND